MWKYGKYLSCDRCPYEDTNECLKCIIHIKDKEMESDYKENKFNEREDIV